MNVDQLITPATYPYPVPDEEESSSGASTSQGSGDDHLIHSERYRAPLFLVILQESASSGNDSTSPDPRRTRIKTNLVQWRIRATQKRDFVDEFGKVI